MHGPLNVKFRVFLCVHTEVQLILLGGASKIMNAYLHAHYSCLSSFCMSHPVNRVREIHGPTDRQCQKAGSKFVLNQLRGRTWSRNISVKL